MADAPGVIPAAPVAPGQAKISEYRAAGLTDQAITSWRQQKTQEWDQAGISQEQQAKYWGETPAQADMIREAMNAGSMSRPPPPKVATNFAEAAGAGYDTSVTGLVANSTARNASVLMGNGEQPVIKTVMPEHPDMGMQIAAGVGQMAGDAPWILASLAGTQGAGLRAQGAAAAGGPEAMRQLLLGALQTHPNMSLGDVWDLVSTGAVKTGEAGLTGYASAGLGEVAGNQLTRLGFGRAVSSTANVAVMATTGAAMGSGMQGHIPTAEDFTTATILALGVHAGAMVGGRFVPSDAGRVVSANAQKIYQQTGIQPGDLIFRANRDPALRQALMAQDVNGDPALNPAVQRNALPALPPRTAPPHVESPVLAQPHSPPPPPRVPPAPGLPVAQGVDHFTRIMQAIEGGLNSDGTARISPAGAIGHNQIMPGTARQYGFDPAKLGDRAYNDHVASVIAADLWKRFQGDEEAMLAAYNAGPGRGIALQRAGPGTRLESVRDPKAPNGKRYYQVQADRDESFLPRETQRYLADGRRVSGGPLPGGAGGRQGAGEGAPPSGGGGGGSGGGAGGGGDWFDPPRPRNGGGGGDEPPAPGARLLGGPDEPGPRRFSWDNVDTDSLYEEANRAINRDGAQPRTFGEHVSNFIKQTVSELEPLRQIDHALLTEGSGLDLDRNKDLLLEDMGRQAQYSAPTIANAMIRWGKVSMEIDPVTGKMMRVVDEGQDSPSVFKAVEQAKAAGGNPEDWEAWMAVNRAKNLKARGIDSPFHDDAAEVLATRKSEVAKYAEATSTLNDALDGGLDFAVQHGLLSAEQAAAMKLVDPVWVSFARVAGDETFDTANPGGRSMKVGKTFYNITGSSEGQIGSPLASVMDNLRKITKNSLRNAVAGSIVALAEGEPQRAADLGLTRLKWDPKATISEAAGKVFEGYDADAIPPLKEAMAPFLAERAFKSFGKNEFGYYRNGVLEKWRVRDPDLAEAIRGADSPAEAHAVVQAFEFVAKVMRAGVTVPLDFAFRMTGIDQFMGYMLDPLHPAPFTTLFKGIKSAVTLDATYKEWIANGGGGAAITALDADYMARDIHKIFQETGAWGAMMNVAQHPLEFAQIINERLEAADRVGYYKIAKARGIDPIKAATMSRNFKLDFAEKGTSSLVSTWARITPFFKTGILGLNQTGRAIVANPGEAPIQSALKPTQVAYRAILAVTLPTVALYVANYLQDKYGDLPEARKFKNLPQWEKDTMFVAPEIAGVRFRLARPRELGQVFGAWPQRFLDHFVEHDPHAFDDFANQFWSQMVPNYMPPAMQAPLEGWSGFSFYTGRPIEPASVAEAQPAMHYTENTTEVAKGLTRFLKDTTHGVVNWSPMIVENYVNRLSGTGGMAALRFLDTPFKQGDKPWEVADVPFVQGFVVRNPGMSAAPIQSFFDAYGQVKEAKADKTVARRRKDLGEFQDAQQDPLAHVSLDAFAHALSVKHQEIIAINHNTTMTTDEKRQYIEAAYSRMIVIARTGLARVDAAKAGTRQNGPGSNPFGN